MNSHFLWRESGRRVLVAFAGIIVLVFSFIAFTANANAATCTFASAGTSDWNTAANWDCGHVPTSTDDVVIPAATTTVISADATSSAITIGTGAALNFGIWGHLYIYGDWVDAGASLTGGGAQEFVGSASTTITGTTSFNEFVINKSGTGGVTLNSSIDARNNVQLESGNLDLQTFTITFDYNWNNTGGRLMGSGTVECDSTYQQSLIGEPSFYNLHINKPSNQVRLSTNVTTTNDITLTSGAFDINGNTFALGGDWNVAGGTLDNTTPGRVRLYSGVDQYLDGEVFGHLIIDKAGGIVYLNDDVTVSFDFLLANQSLNALTHDFTVDRWSFTDPGTVATSTSGTLSFGDDVTIGGSLGSITGDIIFDTTSTNNGTLELGSGTTTFNNDFVNNGTVNANSATIQIYKSWSPTGTFNPGSSSTVVFKGSEPVQYVPSAIYANLTIDKTGGSAYLNGEATTTVDVNVTAGIFNINNKTIHVGGDWLNNGGLTSDGGVLALVDFYGTATQSIVNESNFPDVLMSKSSGLVNASGVTVGRSFTTTGAGVWSNGSSVFQVNGTSTIGAGTTVTSTSGNISFGGQLTNNGTLETDSGLILSYGAGTTTNNGTIHIGSTGMTVYNNLVNTGTLTGDSGVLELHGSWTESGIFNAGTGLVKFAGTVTQTAPLLTYYNLVIEKTNAGDIVNLGGNALVGNDFTLNQGTFSLGSRTLRLRGDWTHTAGVFSAGTGTVEFTGTADQSVGTEENFYNVTMSKASGIVNSTGDFRATNQFTSSGGGTWNAGANSFRVNATTTIGAGTTVTSTSGGFTFSGELANAGNLGTENGLISIHATFTNDGTLNMGSTGLTTWGGTIINNGTFNANSGTLTLRGPMTSAGSFNPGSSTVVIDGSSDYNLPILTYYNLTIEKDNIANTADFAGNVTTTNDFRIQRGTVDLGTYTLAVGGDWSRSSTLQAIFTPGAGLVDFYGSGDADIFYGDFADLRISKASGVVRNNNTLSISGDLTAIGGGTFNLQGTSFTVGGAATINSGATVTSTSGTMQFNGAVSSTGSIGTNSGSMTFGSTYVNNGLFDPGISGATITHNATTTNNGTIDQTSATSHIIYNADMINNGVINTNGKLTFNAGFTNNGTYNPLGNNQTVFGGLADQTVPSISMDTFRIDKTAGTATLGGNVTTTVAFENSSSTLAVGDYILNSGGTYANTGLITQSATGTIVHAGTAKITNAAGSEVATISAPGTIYVTITDGNRNMDGTLVESFTISVTDGKDTESMTLVETGQSTGAFRNSTALNLINAAAIGVGNNYFELTADSTGSVSYTDNQDSSDISSDTAAFDYTLVNNGGGSPGGGGGGGGGAPLTYVPYVDPLEQERLDSLEELGIEIHSLIKLLDDGDLETQADSAVYYVGSDGRRHAFSNAKVFFTWYSDFAGVVEVSLEDIATIPLGANVTYKPGVRMVKFMTDPKVYVVSKGGVLHWVQTEDAAKELYGELWNQNVDDISDAFYLNYKISSDYVAGIADYDPAEHRASVVYPSDSLNL